MNTQTMRRPAPAAVTHREHTCGGCAFCPAVDILETAQELTVSADMPGVKPGDVDLQFENGMLTIHGKVGDREQNRGEFLLREYGVGDFYRTFQVSEVIDAGRISAEHSHGVLTIHLPKVEAVRQRKIEVRAK